MSPTQTAETPVKSAPAFRDPVLATQPQVEWAPIPQPARNRKRFPTRLVTTLAVLALVGTGAFALLNKVGRGTAGPSIQLFDVVRRSFPVILQEKGELKAARTADARCELEGKSTIIFLVPEGSPAKKGDLLVELASDEIDEKIREAEIKVATTKAAYEAAQKELQITRDKGASDVRKGELAVWVAENTLEKYKNGDAVQLLKTDELALAKAEYVLLQAKEKLADSEELYKKGFITLLELKSDRFSEYQAGQEKTKADLALTVTKTYTIPIATQEKESEVREAKKELERTKSSAQAAEDKGSADVDAKQRDFRLNEDKLKKLVEQKVKAKVYAPADGLVVYFREDWDEEPRIKVGAQVVERQRLIELPDTSSMKVALRVHEAKVERLRTGLPATVEIEGFTGRRFSGQISSIAVLAEAQHWSRRDLKEYETDVLLNGTFTDLKPGVTARAEILLTELKNVLAVPVQAVFGKGGKYYVFVDKDGVAAPVEVKTGLSSTEFVEIKSGLNEHDRVRLAVTDELKLKLPDNEAQGENGGERRQRRRPASQPTAQVQPIEAPTTRPAAKVKPISAPAAATATNAPAAEVPTTQPQ